MNGTDAHEHHQAPAKTADGHVSPAAELQSKADAEEQREDRIELALYDHVFEKLDRAIDLCRRQLFQVAIRVEQQAEEHERIGEENATHGDAPQYIESDDAVFSGRRAISNAHEGSIVIPLA